MLQFWNVEIKIESRQKSYVESSLKLSKIVSETILEAFLTFEKLLKSILNRIDKKLRLKIAEISKKLRLEFAQNWSLNNWQNLIDEFQWELANSVRKLKIGKFSEL